MSRLSIYLLGDFRVRLEDRMITRMFRTDKERALLAFLAIEADRPHSRDMLAEFLWPERAEGVARTNLRQALLGVRKAVGDRNTNTPYLKVQDEFIQFDPLSKFWMDTIAFTNRFQSVLKHPHLSTQNCLQCAQQLQEAVDLYRQDFFEGTYLKGNPRFQEWITFQREQFFRYLIMALDQLSDFFKANGDFETAHRYTWQYVKRAPLEEKAHRRLMELLALNGHRSAAIEQYFACRQTLKTELGVEPSRETSELFEAIRDGKTLAGAQPTPMQDFGPSQSGPQLPLQLTTFINREAEIDWFARCLSNPACRLVTIIGMAGVGKTRLAIEVAGRNSHQFKDGVKYIPLESVASPDMLVLNIARAFGLSIAIENSLGHLLRQLQDRSTLIIIDHFDPFIEQTDLLLEILAIAPGIKIILTTRQRLNYQAACLLQLGGLAFPSKGDLPEVASAYPSVQMFLNRAERTQPRFSLTPENLVHIIEICKLVGGHPLGIELAATCLRRQTVRQIAYQLRFGLNGLETSLMDIPERHRKMESAIEPSWEALSEHEKRLYPSLSVFQGDFSYQAAQEIVNVDRPTLIQWVEASMLEEFTQDRFVMHPLLKSFASKKLALQTETQKLVSDRHSHYYLDYLCDMDGALGSEHERKQARRDIEAEIGNILLALDRAVSLQNQAAIHASLACLENLVQGGDPSPAKTLTAQTAQLPPSAAGEFSFVAEILQASGFYGAGERRLEEASNAILIEDHNHNIISANYRACKLSGYTKEDLQNLKITDLEPEATAPRPGETTSETGGAPFITTLINRSGEQIPVEIYRFPFLSNGDKLRMSIIRSTKDPDQVPLEEITKTVPITGLISEAAFSEKLRRRLSLAAHRGLQLAVLMLDISNFTEINRQFGHTSGDKLIKALAVRLRASMRERDIIAHGGGDKFVFLLDELPKEDIVAVVAAKIQQQMQKSFEIDSQEIEVSGRIGVSIYPNDGDDPETLIENAARMVFDDD